MQSNIFVSVNVCVFVEFLQLNSRIGTKAERTNVNLHAYPVQLMLMLRLQLFDSNLMDCC